MGRGKHLGVSEVARRLNRLPRDVSDLLYQRRVDTDRLVWAAGRWLIPEDLVPVIEQALADRDRTRRERHPAGTSPARLALPYPCK